MANYQYDEGGNMAAYFLITALVVVLVPFTISMSLKPASRRQPVDGCRCQPCLEHRASIQKRERSAFFTQKVSKKTGVTIAGWVFLLFLVYHAAMSKAEHKLYDPYEILGLGIGVTEKEVKSHYKKLSKLFHPDKVKPTINLTLEAISNKFVEITKAYKSLTDETTRQNWELYGHPDGRQQTSVGIALPTWVIEGKNNIWVLGFYGIVFGGALPVLVGRWWFGTRQKTKDGVYTSTAATFFKSLRPESEIDGIVGTLVRAFEWEGTVVPAGNERLRALEESFEKSNVFDVVEMKKLAGITEAGNNEASLRKRRALILLYAHMLRLPVVDPSLQAEQTALLLETPVLLSALLAMSTARSWLLPTLSIMRLHTYLAQALPPVSNSVHYHRLAQLPGMRMDKVKNLVEAHSAEGLELEDFIRLLEKKEDESVEEVKKAVEVWRRLELVDASFKVIGERLVTPSAIVYLVVKLRLAPPTADAVVEPPEETDVETVKRALKRNDEKDYQFLIGQNDAEEVPNSADTSGWAHAPYWPASRKPAWWLVLADDKMSRIVRPPLKITDVPFSNPSSDRNYRSYKIQFQAPPAVGLFTWKVCLVSDTFVGEELYKDLALKVDDVSALNADEQGAEDEISDPDENSLAGQMTLMRGGNVRKIQEGSDDESGTDDDMAKSSDSESD